MLTFDRLKTYFIEKRKMRQLDDDLLRTTIRETAQKRQLSFSDLNPVSTDPLLFELPTGPVRDYSFVAYRANDTTNLLSSANQLTNEEFNSTELPYAAATEDIQIDYSEATIRFKTAFDPDTEYLALVFQEVDIEAVTDILLGQLALTDRITESTRSNVTEKRKTYGDMLRDRVTNRGISSFGTIEEIDCTRVSCGRVYGVGADTGEVIP